MQRIALAFVLAAIASGQKFDVASIKPSHGDIHRVAIGMRPGGRFNAQNVSVKQLITIAYNVREYQVTGLPSWADSDRYDIDAKPEGASATPPPAGIPSAAELQTQQEKMRAMLRDLLADRFGLKIHRESKELPIYALVVAKNGPKLEESKQQAPADGDRPRGQTIRMGRGQVSGELMQMSMLVNQLSTILGRNVVDKTGLTGRYDIKMSWTPEDGEGGLFRGPRPDGPPPPASGDSGPSLFTAIQEQLGLRLDSQKGPVDLIVVDHVDKPSEN
ncbi:MAG: TIGR03435 family protein [Acidobacteriia bacterium]|nr:TIGR03435 family protein [Terriglobia bacterium]